jgi:aspartyl-tRNA synthetase
VFSETIAKGGVVAGLAVPGQGGITRNQLDGLTDLAKSNGAAGLIWVKIDDRKLESSVDKFVSQAELKAIVNRLGAKSGDLCLLISGPWQKAYSVLGALRMELAARLQLINHQQWDFLWVVDFPLLEFDEAEQRHVAVHHPFTSPKPEDVSLLNSKPLQARARAYDLVLNGREIAGGSIRIFSSELQSTMFQLLGIGPDEAKEKFGFMLDAFRYGAPPHGGIAFGVDRIIMLMTGQKSIRDVIAFPKTASAVSLMDDAPSSVDERQLKELHLRIV